MKTSTFLTAQGHLKATKITLQVPRKGRQCSHSRGGLTAYVFLGLFSCISCSRITLPALRRVEYHEDKTPWFPPLETLDDDPARDTQSDHKTEP